MRDSPAHVPFCNGVHVWLPNDGLARREGPFSANRVCRGSFDRDASVDDEGSPDAWRACVIASRQETPRVDGIQCRCPPAEQWAPFVRGCVPKDIDPSHDTGRVRSLVQHAALTTAGTASAHGWCFFLQPKVNGLRFVIRNSAERCLVSAEWRTSRARRSARNRIFRRFDQRQGKR